LSGDVGAVARAIYENAVPKYSQKWDELSPSVQAITINDARAAMRETLRILVDRALIGGHVAEEYAKDAGITQ
jgi:hypothetical protein